MPAHGNRVWFDDDLDEAIEMLAAGKTRDQVAIWLGCTPGALRHALRRWRPEGWAKVRVDATTPYALRRRSTCTV